MEEILIAKIDHVNDFGVGLGIAQNIEWKVYRRTWPETEMFKAGQFVACRVNYDGENDEFYLQRLEANYQRNEAEWSEQEGKSIWMKEKFTVL